MEPSDLARFCVIQPEAKAHLRHTINEFGLSARAYDRILRVARTIADLEGAEHIQPGHLAEAIGYRNLDREDWATR